MSGSVVRQSRTRNLTRLQHAFASVLLSSDRVAVLLLYCGFDACYRLNEENLACSFVAGYLADAGNTQHLYGQERRSIMNAKSLFFSAILSLVLISAVAANPIPTPQIESLMHYVRGTMGEPHVSEDMDMADRNSLVFGADFQYSGFAKYLDGDGKKHDFDYELKRYSALLSLDFGLTEDVEIGVRLPVIRLRWDHPRYALTNSGISDLLARVRVDPLGDRTDPVHLAFGAGVKFPTGEYELGDNLMTGTGTTDLVFMLYSSTDLDAIRIYSYAGYAVTGSRGPDLPFVGDDKENLGNVFSFTVVLSRAVSPILDFRLGVDGHLMASSHVGDIQSDNGMSLISLCPCAALTIPKTMLILEGGISHDLYGEYVLSATGVFLRATLSKPVKWGVLNRLPLHPIEFDSHAAVAQAWLSYPPAPDRDLPARRRNQPRSGRRRTG